MPTPSASRTDVRGRADACPGALRLHSAQDGFLARIRIPGGRLTVSQARVLGAAAAELGDGNLDLTSRGNVQMRGLAADAGVELTARLHGAAMLPSLPHDRARNIVASPLSGLDGQGHLDVSAWVPEVDDILCRSSMLTQLSGRFLIGLDDGRGDVIGQHADLTVIAADGRAHLRLSDVDTPLTVAAVDAPRLAVDAAAAFLTVRAEQGADAWRVAELPDAVRLIIARLSGADYVVLDEHAKPPEPIPPALGVISAPEGGVSLSAQSRLGRVSAVQWRAVVELAADGLRITPWRGIVLPHVGSDHAGAALSELGAAGFVTTAAGPWAGATACTGRPGCARSLSDVRGDAITILSAAPPGAAGLPVHVSGCTRRCGHPNTPHVEAVATDTGYRVGQFGQSSTSLAAEQIPDAVTALRRQTRE